jgi:hypothetical protein
VGGRREGKEEPCEERLLCTMEDFGVLLPLEEGEDEYEPR